MNPLIPMIPNRKVHDGASFGRRSVFRCLMFILICLGGSAVFAQKYNISDVSSVAGSRYYCSGTSTSNLSPVTATFNVAACGTTSPASVGTVVVKWFVCTSATNCGTLLYQESAPISVGAATTVTFTLQASRISNSAGTRYYYCEVSAPTVSGCGFNGTLSTITAANQGGLGNNGYLRLDFVSGVTVNAPVWSAANPTNVCRGQSYTFTVNPMNAATSYAWSYSGTGVNFTGATSSNTVTVSYSSTATAGSISVVGSGSGCSGTATATVTPTLSTPPSFTAENLTGRTTCINNAFAGNPSVTASGTGTTYQWFKNTTAAATGGTAIATATAATYIPPVTVAGTNYYYAVATNGSCSTTSNVSGAFVVNPATTITAPPSPTTALSCLNGSFPALTVAAAGASPAYAWYSNATASNTGGTLIAGATGSTYTPPATAVGTRYYYAVATGCGSATSSVSGPQTVNATTAITAQLSSADQSACSGGAFPTLAFTAVGAGLTYQWFNNSTASASGGMQITGANGAAYTPPTSVSGGLYYYATVNGNCGTATTTVSGLHTLKPTPTFSAAAQDSIVSAGPVRIRLTGLLPNSIHAVNYSIAGATASSPATAVAADANGTAYFDADVSGGGLTTAHNGYTLSVNSLSVTSNGSPNCTTSGLSSTVKLTVSNTTRSRRSNDWTKNDPTWTNSVPSPDAGACDTGTNAGSGTCFGPPVFIGHDLEIDQDVVVRNGVYYFGARGVGQYSNSTIADEDGGAAHNLTISRNGGYVNTQCIVDIQSGTTRFEGSLSIDNGSLYIRNGATLIVGSCADAANPGVNCTAMSIGNNSAVYIEQGGALIVHGDVINNNNGSGSVSVVGYLQINGDYSASQGNVNISGSGEFVSTGSMSTSGNSSIFGSSNDCLYGPCSGTALACGGGTSYTFALTTNGVAGATQVNVCDGATANLSFSTTAPTPVYQWQSSTVSPSSGFTDIVGATSLTFVEVPQATTYYRMKYTPSGCNALFTYPVTVTPTDYPVVVTQPSAPASVCQGAVSPVLSVSVTLATGSIQSYKWYAAGNATPLITNTSAASSDSYSIPTAAAGAANYYVDITTAAGCKVSSAQVPVTVTVAPTSATISGTATVCAGTPVNLSVSFAGSAAGPFSVTYRNSQTGMETTVVDYVSGAAIPVIPNATTTYALTAASSGTAPSVCPAQSLLGLAAITVNPVATAAVLTSAYAGDQTTLCHGSSGSMRVDITGGTSPYSVNLSDGSVIASYISGAAVTRTPAASTGYSVVSVSDANGCAAAGIAGLVQLNVNTQNVWVGPASGGDWSSAVSWSCGLPNRNFDVTIPNGNVLNVSTPVEVRGLTVEGSLVMLAGSGLTLYGDLASNGTSFALANSYPGCICFAAGATPRVTFAGAGDQSISGPALVSIHDLEIANTAGAVRNDASRVDVYGTVTLPLPTSRLVADGATGTGLLQLRSTGPTHSASIGVLDAAGKFQGKLTVQRQIGKPLSNYRYVSTPVTGFSMNVELWEWLQGGALYMDNETVPGAWGSGYQKLPGTFFVGTNSAGRGFLSWRTPGLWNARGDLNAGTIQLPLTYTNSNTLAADGWNLVGNPYPSPVIWNNTDWVRTNVDAVVYVPDIRLNRWNTWDANLATGNNPADFSGVIAMGQAFWIRANAASPVLRVMETAKRPTHASAYTRSSGSDFDVLEVEISRDSVADAVLLGLMDETTPEFDPGVDAIKLPGGDLNVSLMAADATPLVHQWVSGVDEAVIPLEIQAPPGTYRMKIADHKGQGGFEGLHLVDHWLGTSTPVGSGHTVTFEVTADAASQKGRFVLSSRRGGVVEEDVFQVYPNPVRDVVQIRYRSTSPVRVSVVSSAGAEFRSETIDPVDGEVFGNVDMSACPSGIYVLKLEVSGKVLSRKVVKY